MSSYHIPRLSCVVICFVLQLKDDNITIDDIEYNTKFAMIDARRKQGGIYKIVAENIHGKDEAEVEIVVLCMLPRVLPLLI